MKITSSDKVISKIYTTKDYSKFNNSAGNRTINTRHARRLQKSMEEAYLFTAIIVNEKFEIIDGQHRFEAIKELGLPINYIMVEGYGLSEIQRLNENAKTWTLLDFLDGYCDLGKQDYIDFKRFRKKYQLGVYETITIISGTTGRAPIEDFKKGRFVIRDYQKACRAAEKVLAIDDYYEGSRRRAFVYAMISLLNNENFDVDQFVQKVKLNPTKMVDCTTAQAYRDLIEDIYNYKRKEKVSLRYSSAE